MAKALKCIMREVGIFQFAPVMDFFQKQSQGGQIAWKDVHLHQIVQPCDESGHRYGKQASRA